jgi:hypothetical protein
MPILVHGYLLVILLWSSYVDSLLFCKFWFGDGYNCSNTCLYALWSTLILNLMYNITFFSWFVFDEFIVKGGEYGHKVGRTLANRVDERRNMINNYLRGEHLHWECQGELIYGGVLILSFCFDFESSSSSDLFLALSRHFVWLCRFSYFLLAFAVFLLLDDLLELFLTFWVF